MDDFGAVLARRTCQYRKRERAKLTANSLWLGREAVVSYLRLLEGRAARSPLHDLVASALGREAQSVTEVIGWLHGEGSPVSRVANLAPLVSRAADAGDRLAVDILCRAAEALADLAASAAHQLWPRTTPESLAVACCGGVWAAGAHLRRPFESALAQRLPGSISSPPVLPPVAGAVVLAMDGATAPLPDAVLVTLKRAFA